MYPRPYLNYNNSFTIFLVNFILSLSFFFFPPTTFRKENTLISEYLFQDQKLLFTTLKPSPNIAELSLHQMIWFQYSTLNFILHTNFIILRITNFWSLAALFDSITSVYSKVSCPWYCAWITSPLVIHLIFSFI